jgi:hypothetical protein
LFSFLLTNGFAQQSKGNATVTLVALLQHEQQSITNVLKEVQDIQSNGRFLSC